MGAPLETPTNALLVSQEMPGVVTLTLNRPKARNALNQKLREALAEQFSKLAVQSDVRAVVLSGAGGAFAAGADLTELVDASAVDIHLRGTHRLWRAIENFQKPIIAAVDGFALGGGCELALHADIIVASRDAKFGQPEAKVGIMPGAGGTQRLVRSIGRKAALRYVLTGEIFSAQRAYELGLVSDLVEENPLAAALDIAQTIANLPAIAIEKIKEAILLGEDASMAAGLALERNAFQLLFATRDQEIGMKAFLEKRAPDFEGR